MNYLHEYCKANMCEDCIALAKRLGEGNERLKAENRRLRREIAIWEQAADVSLPPECKRWVISEIDRQRCRDR